MSNDARPYVTPSFSQPNEGEYFYVFAFPSGGPNGAYTVRIILTQVQLNMREQLTAAVEATWGHKADDGKDVRKLVCNTNAVLSEAEARDRLANSCTKRDNMGLIDWTKALDYVAQKTQDVLLADEQDLAMADVELPPGEEVMERELVQGFLPWHQATTFFAAGGSLKSLSALTLAMAVQLGRPIGPFKPVQQANVLYLDWETVAVEQARRCEKLCRWLGVERSGVGVRWMKPRGSLVRRRVSIGRKIAERNIGLVVVDSIAPAVGKPMEVHEYVNEFFDVLMGWPVTALVISHVAKAQRGERSSNDPDPTPYGSAFVENRSRAVWFVNNITQPGADDSKPAQVLFKLTKANNSIKNRRSMATFLWRPDGAIEVGQADPASDALVREHLEPRDRVWEVLKRGARTVPELCELLNMPLLRADQAVRSLSDGGHIVQIGESDGPEGERNPRWGLGMRGAVVKPPAGVLTIEKDTGADDGAFLSI